MVVTVRVMSEQSIEVALSGSYGLADLDQLLAEMQPLLALDTPSRVSLNLRALDFVYPTTAVTLCAVLHRLVAEELRVSGESKVQPPDDKDVRNYLLRLDVIQAGTGISLEEPFDRHPTVGFRECQQFSTEGDANRVARELTQALSERCALDDDARLAINTALAELCSNVPHHAATALGGVAAAQGYPQSDRFEAAIVDLGIGIRQSMAENPEYAHIVDDTTAIRAALELGATSKPGDEGPTRHSGYGLAVTQHLLQRNGGRLLVRSGTGAVSVGADQTARTTEVDFPGTLIVLEARTDKPLDVRAVYEDLLGDLDD
jgi:anti-sigma regulatory factor (Ser/Thr protein kinase)